MDTSGKLVLAKHNEITSVDIKKATTPPPALRGAFMLCTPWLLSTPCSLPHLRFLATPRPTPTPPSGGPWGRARHRWREAAPALQGA